MAENKRRTRKPTPAAEPEPALVGAGDNGEAPKDLPY